MAGTIIMSLNCSIENGAYREDANINPVTITQTLVGGGNPGTVSIGFAAEEDISFGDVTPGYVIIENIDDTNFVQIGPKSGGVMIDCFKILAGQFCVFYLDGSVTLRAIADTAAVKLRIRGYAI